MKNRRIAIAGAGIGGLAFAALAHDAGQRVVLFDQFDAPAPVGSGLVIQPVGQAVLGQVGVGAAARALGQPINRMLGHEAASGRVVLDVSYDLGGTERFGLAIHRASLFGTLLEAVRAREIRIHTSHRIAQHQGAYLHFEDRSREGPFDLIVDATGAGSPLSPLTAKPLSYGAIWGTVPWPLTDLPQSQLTQRYRAARHMIGALPIGTLPDQDKPLAAIFWSLPVGDYSAWREAPLDQWKEQAAQLWPAFAPFMETITQHDQMTMARYAHGTLRRPVGDGIAFIGDAAHRASPQLGQGANMALLDAYALAASLAQTHHLPDALATYAKARRWHVLAYQAMSWAFTPQYQSDSRVLPLIRDHVFMPISRMPPIPKILSRLVCGDMLPPFGSLSLEGA